MYKHGFIKVAAVTPKISVGEIQFNKQEILKVLNASKAAITVFPELTITGYSASDLFYQESFIQEAKQALNYIIEQASYQGIYIIGIPLDIYGVLYNCAVVVKGKEILGVIPKHYLPNYHEFYEKRWFQSGKDSVLTEISLLDQQVPFGYLVFEEKEKNIRFGVEICQDVWATYSPSDDMSLAGANLILNLSASSEYVGKQTLRRNVVLDHSRKQMAAYVYTTSGHYESSSETVFSSHKVIAALGELIVESAAFTDEESHLYADIDMMGINYQKRQDSTYRDMHLQLKDKYQYVDIKIEESIDYQFEQSLDQTPFISKLHKTEDIKVANHLQIFALIKRLESLPKSANKIVLGISGGLDSALALLVSHQAMLYLKRDPKDIIAVTMPAEVTSKTSKSAALGLMEKLGVTTLEIPISEAVNLHLESIDHQALDVTYENTQARMRTLILMNLANKYGGFVLGTGDLSEIALGWMTYNGDQMSMYAINAGLPKTWVKLLIDYHAKHQYKHVADILNHILEAPITPELISNQDTEKSIGRYDINDFILYHHLQMGADELKVQWMISKAFDLDDEDSKIYVNRFFKRFYTQQFKRQTLPEGPKILGISLSPRGEYRMPSDVKKESDMMKKNKKVIIGLSGGVDSSVAAYLLLKDGYDVEAVFMRNWDSATNNDLKGNPTKFDDVCEQEKDYQDAVAVANKLGIKLHKVDFIDDYWDRVFTYFLDEYKKNRTPNPDVLCNNEIKFKAFVDYVQRFDADYIAMGHYAQVDLSGDYPKLIRAADQNKDQTYFLSQLREDQLKNVLFPIGHLDKSEVRKIALEQGLATAKKKDSTGICFIGERHFNEFLSNYLPAQPGDMKKLDGTYMKKHQGLMNYTIGQRKGLGIGGTKEDTGAWYVVGKDLKTNTLFVEPDFDHPHLYSDEAIITDVVWRGKKFEGNLTAKFRYRQKDHDVFITWIDEKTIRVSYPQKVRAVTPGQVCAFYQKDVCVGSGFISEVFMDKKRRLYS